MTPARKAELEKYAYNFLHQHNHFKKGEPQNCDLKCLTDVLEHVEWEVWQRVIVEVQNREFGDCDDFEQWCRTQAKETT